MSYGYVPQYVTEEQDLSESDCPSDEHVMQHVTADVTELYRRKQQAINHARNATGTYYHTHMPSYYEQQQQPRLPTTCACNLPPDPRYCYKAAPQSQDGMFRSTTQLTPNLRTCPEPKAVSAATIKKYPITARTPRYYRTTGGQICKRPSTLCLPVTCQPDPAMFHRSRKAPTEIQHYRGQEAAYAINDYVMRTTTAVKRTDTRPVDSEGDVNSKLNDLENLLTKFDDDEDDGDNDQVEITGVNDISKILKPKIPPSLKAKQENILKVRAMKTNLTETIATTENINKLEVKEAPPESLKIFLQRFQTSDNGKRNDSNCKNPNEGKEVPQKRTEITTRQKQSFSFEQKQPPLDDNSALELHKSKSYIVSLIDKALSKELGTVPGDKCTAKEFMNMNPKKAVELVNRHSIPKDIETNMGYDVAQAGSSRDRQCVCKNEEPLYLKQLKQLRWSHLRHIQREAKRLADLERFLDSFSSEADSPS